MFDRFWDLLIGYWKDKPYWAVLQPLLMAITGYVALQIFAYEYIVKVHGFTPSPQLFLKSYISIRITIVFIGILLLMLLFKLRMRREQSSLNPGKITGFLIRNRGIILFRSIVVLIVLIGLTVAFNRHAPRKVSNIRIKFMSRPKDFSDDAFAYLIYELNRQQKNWYFEVDFRVFNPVVLSLEEAEACENSPHPVLCQAEAYAKDLAKKSGEASPLIGISTEPLGDASFWQHEKKVSVITTADSAFYAPVMTYEYLLHCLIVQGILLHLDANGSGVPAHAYEESSVSHGGVFETAPRKETIKSTILAARLSPQEEELLFNRFGPAYMDACRTLLSLEWFRSERIKENLKKNFGVKDP